MKKEYTREELLHKAASYCSMAEHCTAEVADKLTAWNVADGDKKFIISHLLKDGFIDEKRYSAAFVKDKFRFNKWGKIKISMALRQKNLPEELISTALQQIDEGEYDEMLSEILKSKLKTITWEYEYEKMGKLFAFAQSRGFESSVIDRVIRSLEVSEK